MKVKVAIGTTVKNEEGKVIGTGGDVIDVDDAYGRALLAGGSAELPDQEKEKPRRGK